MNSFKDDGDLPVEKPDHAFSKGERSEQLEYRLRHDQSICYVHAEFARLFQFLENSSITKDTWIVFTSDHGEMFERGITGHDLPPWREGEAMPAHRETPLPEDRSLFSIHGRHHPRLKPIKKGSMLELFHLVDDPNEITNLYHEELGIAAQMLDEIHKHVNQADKPYR